MDAANIEDIKSHLAVVLGHRTGDIRAAIAGLDALKQEASGHLAHYLAKRSYQKAWIQLEGGDPERGVCGGHH